ncbi:MAG TPA: VTT domain-containing protein [Chloroflexia bacterium]|nr:VTT domain-containing protein [Chloroflexia bacterium]
MSGIDTFLDMYGLPAIFGLMLVKAAGVPVPVPGDFVLLATAARASSGKFPLWLAFVALLAALVAGGTVQYLIARGPGRKFLYRFGRYTGLTRARLDGASSKVRKSSPLGYSLLILTPGVRSLAIPAGGLAGMALSTFLTGVVLGSFLDLSLHFFIGYFGASILGNFLLPVLVLLLVTGFAGWYLLKRRHSAHSPHSEVLAETVVRWSEAACPVCLGLGAISKFSPEREVVALEQV